ncbi:malate dehydrogenase [Laetiporus sulphureus 93-53]|uniref:malate dehydrogenase n=1 Tax=Laetiporus sulphureus 93-53 TaxID=1314785 RepID=A0A165IKX9_9APHY|nr:malate dehydrogenase [Laetiporus sulphureus 93-53]KZT13222.1 malate dehydrogenase [Laetiporus sulphureus 93-53]
MMFARSSVRTLTQARQFSSSSARQTKVTVLGAGGGIGQPLSLLLKLDPHVKQLNLYDIRGAPGVAADVGHIDTGSEVQGFAADKLDDALEGVDVVICPAGVPRKPGMSRDDLFATNASVLRDLATAVARVSPKAIFLIITNPVNSVVPIASRVFEKAGVYDPKRIFGVSALDVVRATRFVAALTGKDPKDTPITVVGGHSGETIVPLFSQSPAAKTITGEAYKNLVHRVQFGGDEVVQAKAGAGSATLSMAYAGAKFANALFRGLAGEKGVIIPSYVKSPLYASQGVEFFASPIELGPNGVEKIHPVGQITEQEQELLKVALEGLKKNIQKGYAFVQ